jgi:hypothetical protein
VVRPALDERENPAADRQRHEAAAADR